MCQQRCAQAALKDCDRIFAGLIALMQKKCNEVKDLIISQEKTAVTHVAWAQHQLEEDITKLRMRDTGLEQLLHTDNHIYLIQVTDTF